MSSNALLWPSQGTIPERMLDKYKWLKLPSQGFGGVVVPPPPVSIAMAYEPATWADASYLQRIVLQINAGQVPSTQNDFPLLINSTFTELIGESVGSIRIGAQDFTLEYEIQEFDDSTGELIAWVKAPSISNGSLFFVYFDNPNAPDNQNPAAVWDANYKGVYHLDGVGTDSTKNGQDFTKFLTTTVTGKIGQAIDFPGNSVNDYLIRNPFSGFPSTEFTCEFWIAATASGDGIVSYASSPGAGTNDFLLFNQDGLQVFITTVSEPTGISFNNGIFRHIVITWRSSDGQLFVYMDGVQVFSSIHQLGTSFVDNGSLVLGQDQDQVGGGFSASQALNGILDELRISNIFRSADYVTTSFNNQSAPDTFYTNIGSQNVPPAIDTMAYAQPLNWFDTDFLQRFPLTINSGQVPSTQTNVPLLINGTFPELINEVEAELRFAGTDEVQLEYEIQKFDDSTGELIAWVKKPTVSNGDVIFVYFDNPIAVDEQDAFAVWSDYSNVYHLNNTPVGAGSILDSAVAQEPGDPVGMTLVAGKIGMAQQFDDTNIGLIEFPNYDVDFSFSVSIWIKTVETNRGVIFSIGVNTNGATDDAIFTEVQGNGTVRFVYRNPPAESGGININSSPVTVNDGNFHKIVFVYDDAGDNQEIFIDGVSVVSAVNTLPAQTTTGSLDTFLGVSTGTTEPQFFDGIMDEFQTFVGVLSADRITTEFNNQNDQDTFYTKGAVEAVPAATIAMGYEA